MIVSNSFSLCRRQQLFLYTEIAILLNLYYINLNITIFYQITEIFITILLKTNKKALYSSSADQYLSDTS